MHLQRVLRGITRLRRGQVMRFEARLYPKQPYQSPVIQVVGGAPVNVVREIEEMTWRGWDPERDGLPINIILLFEHPGSYVVTESHCWPPTEVGDVVHRIEVGDS